MLLICKDSFTYYSMKKIMLFTRGEKIEKELGYFI